MEGHDAGNNNEGAPNEHLITRISSLIASSTIDADSDYPDPRTELEIHANMMVIGRNCFVVDEIHGKFCNVEPFDPSIGTSKKVPVVDASIAYDCPYISDILVYHL